MPLSQDAKAVAAAVGIEVDDATTDAQVMAAAAKAIPSLETKYAEQATTVTTLSADVERLEGELEAANEAVESKGREVLSLSASNPRKLDPVNVAMFRRNVNQARERALSAGAPPELLKAIDARVFKGPEKEPTVFALSADGPAAEPAGFWIYDTIADLAESKWGKGVMTGAATRGRAVLQASATASDDGPDSDTEAQWAKEDEALKARLLATAKA